MIQHAILFHLSSRDVIDIWSISSFQLSVADTLYNRWFTLTLTVSLPIKDNIMKGYSFGFSLSVHLLRRPMFGTSPFDTLAPAFAMSDLDPALCPCRCEPSTHRIHTIVNESLFNKMGCAPVPGPSSAELGSFISGILDADGKDNRGVR